MRKYILWILAVFAVFIVGCNNQQKQEATQTEGDTMVSPLSVSSDTTYYVSSGRKASDSNPGTQKSPFKTIDYALTQMSAGDNLVILDGTYDPFTIPSSLSGSETNPTVISGNSFVNISSGVELNRWKNIRRNEATQISSSVRNKIVVSNLPSGTYPTRTHQTWNISIGTKLTYPVIYQDGKFLTEARWPNTGYVYIEEILPENTLGAPRFRANLNGYRTPQSELDVWVIAGSLSQRRWMQYHEPLKLANSSTGRVEIDLPQPHHFDGGRQPEIGQWPGRFFMTNSLYELDAPGEYYIDHNRNRVYLYPLNDTRDIFIANRTSPLIEMNGVSNVVVQNMNLIGGQENGINLNNSNNVTLDDLRISAVAGTGIVALDSENVTVSHTTIRETGEGGIWLRGGERSTLTHSGNLVDNCLIEDIGLLQGNYRPGIRLQGCGNVVNAVTIRRAPHVGILFDGAENTMQNILIEDVCLNTGDAAAIYSWADILDQGNLINNVKVTGVGLKIDARYPVHAIYLDGSKSGVTITNSVFEDCDMAINAGSGFGNVIDNIGIANTTRGITIHSHPPLDNEIEYAISEGGNQEPWLKYTDLQTLLSGGTPQHLTITNMFIDNVSDPVVRYVIDGNVSVEPPVSTTDIYDSVGLSGFIFGYQE
jgi:hypothetical protein